MPLFPHWLGLHNKARLRWKLNTQATTVQLASTSLTLRVTILRTTRDKPHLANG